MIPILSAFKDWECPNCGLTDRTPASVPNRHHVCPKLRGLIAPLIPAGTKARITARDRDDYVGAEKVTTDETGRPVMSIVTERPDGSNDTIVFAPTATLAARST